jgi:TfoX/Sxy family transcriptional regulator of competence genes
MELLDRVRAQLPSAQEKRMFGGTAFLVDGAMACAVSDRGLLVRVQRAARDSLVAQEGVEVTVMGGRSMRGWVHVNPAVVPDDAALRGWLDRGVEAARDSLSPGQ